MATKRTNTKTSTPARTVQTPNILECPSVDVSGLTFTEIDYNNKYVASQGISYVHYKNNEFYFKTEPIEMVQGGIPEKNEFTEKFYKTDADRQFLNIPFNPADPNSVALFEMLGKIDARVLELKSVFFGDRADKYTYIPLIREPNETELPPGAKPSDKPKVPKMKSCKVKLDVDYATKKLETSFWVTNPETKTPEPATVNTIDEARVLMPWRSKVRFVIKVAKLWCDKVPKKKGQPMEFGIGLKCMQLDVKERPAAGGQAKEAKEAFKHNFAFGDSPSPAVSAVANVSQPEPSAQEAKVLESINAQAETIDQEEEEEEDEEDEGEGDEEEDEADDDQPVVQKLVAAKVEPVKVVAPVPAPAPAPVVQVAPAKVKATKSKKSTAAN